MERRARKKAKKKNEHYVYGLKHPVTLKFIYVGSTERLDERTRQHKDMRIADALSETKIQKPVVVILQVVNTRKRAYDRELAWIKKLLSENHPLVNLTGVRKHVEIKKRKKVVVPKHAWFFRVPPPMRLALQRLAREKNVYLSTYVHSILFRGNAA